MEILFPSPEIKLIQDYYQEVETPVSMLVPTHVYYR